MNAILSKFSLSMRFILTDSLSIFPYSRKLVWCFIIDFMLLGRHRRAQGEVLKAAGSFMPRAKEFPLFRSNWLVIRWCKLSRTCVSKIFSFSLFPSTLPYCWNKKNKIYYFTFVRIFSRSNQVHTKRRTSRFAILRKSWRKFWNNYKK